MDINIDGKKVSIGMVKFIIIYCNLDNCLLLIIVLRVLKYILFVFLIINDFVLCVGFI